MTRLYFLLALMLATAAHAEVIEALEFQEYQVRSDGGKSLLAAINSASPIHHGGQIYHGYTKWNVRWNFWWNSDRNGNCKIDRSKVHVSGVIQLPNLIGGTASQRGEFDRYIRNLRIHEMGHYDIGKRAAARIDSFLLSLPARSSCASVESEANSGAYRLLDEYIQLEKQYDLDTQHGKTQGAWLTN